MGVLSRAPVPGRCKTRLAAAIGSEGAANLSAAMLRDTLAAFDRLPAARKVLFAAPEDDGVAILRPFAPEGWSVEVQSGADLGERMAAAMRTMLALSPAAILVGSDCPTAPIDAVASALPHLAGPRRAILGPADDGGYWLLGLSTFEPRLFEDVAWSTPDVLASTREALLGAGFDVRELDVGYDVDDVAQLDRLRVELGARPSLAPRTAAGLGVGGASTRTRSGSV